MRGSLRAGLGRYASSVERVRAELDLERPVPLTTLLDVYAEPIAKDAPITTPSGTALGGHHWLELTRSGAYRYHGYMRATGGPSYTFALGTTVTGAGGAPAVILAQGAVHGTNEPGEREAAWDERGVSPQIAEHWLTFRRPAWTWNLRWNSDWIGVLDDWAVGVLSATAVFGNPIGFAIVLGSRLADALDADDLALPGLVGVIVAGGGVLVFGPGAIAPAIVAGVAAGAVVASLVRYRRPEPFEREFADRVFKRTIPWDKVMLTNLLGLGGRPFAMPSGERTIIVNLGAGWDRPIEYTGHGDADTDPHRDRQAPGQLFIHELTHVWQIEHGRFLPGWLCDALSAQSKGKDAYKYGGTRHNWDDYNIEQQGQIVAQWFAGTTLNEPQQPMLESDAHRYWRYIRDNIRGAVS